MKQEVKNVKGSVELAVFQHDDLFHHMRHGMKRRQQHEDRKNDQNRKRKLVEELEHGQTLALSVEWSSFRCLEAKNTGLGILVIFLRNNGKVKNSLFLKDMLL